MSRFVGYVLIISISFFAGYFARMHQEYQVSKSYETQAEEELKALEQEFHDSLKEKREFLIFNGQFKVYPVKYKNQKKFHYSKR